MAWLTLDEFTEEFKDVSKADVRKYIADGMPAEVGPDGPRIIDKLEAKLWMFETGIIGEDDLEEEELEEAEERGISPDEDDDESEDDTADDDDAE